ncbi:TonB-dependent receptor, partial [Acidithiobacillus thiooxidans]
SKNHVQKAVLSAIILGGGSIMSCQPAFADGTSTVANTAYNIGQVNQAAGGGVLPQEQQKLDKKNIQKSGETVKVIGKHEIASASPAGGAAAALAFAPGVNVSSYGGTGASKSSISINGIKTGWAGFSGGNFDNGSIGVSFDGIPMVNPGNGLWQANLVPLNSLISAITATSGPGNVVDQWYNNIGGSLNFVPVEPSKTFSLKISQTYGSFDTINSTFILQTGDLDGWDTVLAGGLGEANNYMTSPDGFKSPSNNYAYGSSSFQVGSLRSSLPKIR